MKASTVRLAVVIAALAVVAAIVPAGSAVFTGVTDNTANSFDSAADFVTNPSFRIVTYEIKTAAGFTGTTHLLTLNQNLASDYFVLLRAPPPAGNAHGVGSPAPTGYRHRTSATSPEQFV